MLGIGIISFIVALISAFIGFVLGSDLPEVILRISVIAMAISVVAHISRVISRPVH